ncbi:Uncharacterized protein BM_BM13579 [Brugia malayi]|uniref:Uncharacterized protein n=1 Tax=Brugia malayi TaxID=6279 RepID=A0A4E9FQM3_BRUMA|nr:Uncharacterized protein BM_BM13579 [Brugia malayi]VIO97998.1 Uncharacterized protein BM_BM13579 [Brugia malayi]
MNAITLLVALIIIDVCSPFYMIARPGGIFKLRNDMNSGLRHYSDRNKKALFPNDPLYHENLYNQDYILAPMSPMMMDYLSEEGNGRGMTKISGGAIPANNNNNNNHNVKYVEKNDGKMIHPIDFAQQQMFSN